MHVMQFIETAEKAASSHFCFRQSPDIINHASQTNHLPSPTFPLSLLRAHQQLFPAIIKLAPPLFYVFCSGPLRVIQAQKLQRIVSALYSVRRVLRLYSQRFNLTSRSPNQTDWLGRGGFRVTRAALYTASQQSHCLASSSHNRASFQGLVPRPSYK